MQQIDHNGPYPGRIEPAPPLPRKSALVHAPHDTAHTWSRACLHRTRLKSNTCRRSGLRHSARQRHSASSARLRKAINDLVGRLHAAQGLARMPFLTTRPLARRLAQAPHPHRLLEPIARWRLAAVGAIKPQLALQLSNPRRHSRNLCRLRRNHRKQSSLRVRHFSRRIPLLQILVSEIESASLEKFTTHPRRYRQLT